MECTCNIQNCSWSWNMALLFAWGVFIRWGGLFMAHGLLLRWWRRSRTLFNILFDIIYGKVQVWTYTQSLKGFSGPSSISNLKELLHEIPGLLTQKFTSLTSSESSDLASSGVICKTQKTFLPVMCLPSTSASISSYRGNALVHHLTALWCACETHASVRSVQLPCKINSWRDTAPTHHLEQSPCASHHPNQTPKGWKEFSLWGSSL